MLLSLKQLGGEKIIPLLKSYILQHSTPKSINTDQYSGFKNTLMSEYCKQKGFKQIFCPVCHYRGCGLVERCIQTIKKNLGTTQLDPNFFDIQSAVKLIIEDIRKSKILFEEKKTDFEIHFRRKPNTGFTLLRDKLLDNLDCESLGRDMLAPQQRRHL